MAKKFNEEMIGKCTTKGDKRKLKGYSKTMRREVKKQTELIEWIKKEL
jgi:hypothetical protein